MRITERTIGTVLDWLGFPNELVGRHYLEDMILERDYYELEGWNPVYTDMVRNVAHLNEVDENSIRRGVRSYVAKTIDRLPYGFPRDKAVLMKMLASVPIAYMTELIFTMMISTEEEDYE